MDIQKQTVLMLSIVHLLASEKGSDDFIRWAGENPKEAAQAAVHGMKNRFMEVSRSNFKNRGS